MRLIALLILSAIVAIPLLPAEAATGTRQSQAQAASRTTSSAPAASRSTRTTTTRATTARGPSAQRATTRRATTTSRSRNQAASTTRNRSAAASCERRDSRGRCVGPRTASWQGGLPTPSNTQADCPAGTMATLARGHSSVTRCMPI